MRLLQLRLNKIRLTILVAIFFTLLAAGVFRTAAIVFMAALLCSAPLLAFLVGRFAGRHIGARRHLPQAATVGDVVPVRVEIENQSMSPALLACVRCDELTAARHAASRAAPLENLGARELVAPLLRPRERIVWRQRWKLWRRGVHVVPPVRAGVIDPLGLFSHLRVKTAAQEIVVLPRVVKVDRLGFLGGAASSRRVPQFATVVADAMDFHGIRAWQPGESIRRVHWKSTARTGQLHVVEWEENYASDVAVLLDTQRAAIAESTFVQSTLDASGSRESTLDVAITLAASIAAHLLESGYKFQLFFWAPDANRGAQLRCVEAHNLSGLQPVLHELARIEVVDDAHATLPQLARGAQSHIPAGRSCVMLASSLAEVDESLHALGGAARAFVLEAASFGAALSGAALSDKRIEASASMRPGTARSPAVRVVRRGEALAAVLENPF